MRKNKKLLILAFYSFMVTSCSIWPIKPDSSDSSSVAESSSVSSSETISSSSSQTSSSSSLQESSSSQLSSSVLESSSSSQISSSSVSSSNTPSSSEISSSQQVSSSTNSVSSEISSSSQISSSSISSSNIPSSSEVSSSQQTSSSISSSSSSVSSSYSSSSTSISSSDKPSSSEISSSQQTSSSVSSSSSSVSSSSSSVSSSVSSSDRPSSSEVSSSQQISSSESSSTSSSSTVSSSIIESSSISSSSSSSNSEISSSDKPSSSESSSTNSSPDSSSSSESVYIDYYNHYYDSLVSWTDGEDLMNQLYEIIRNGYKPISYDSPNWETNQYADQALDNFTCVDQVYSAYNMLKTDTNSGSIGWNREHAFCASLMTGSQTSKAVKYLGRATDFHNLFASESGGNMSRGNKNFGYADTTAASYVDRTVSNGYDGYSYDEKNFEPGDKDKGRLARAIFYMATMYKNDEVDTVNNITMKGLTIKEEYVDYAAGEAGQFAIGNLNDLLKWNLFAVDMLEFQHNQSVYSHLYKGTAQGNRNPYVDFPELVDYVYGAKKNTPGRLADLTASASYVIDSSFSNYAITSAKQSYFVGDTLTSADYTLVALNKDFTTSEIDFENTNVPYTFVTNDIDRFKYVTINTPKNSITYYVNVSSPGLSLCNYKIEGLTTTSFADLKDKAAGTYDFKLNNIDWSATWTNSAFKISNNKTNGVQIGTSKLSISKLTFTSKDDFNYGNYSCIDSIYIKCNTASGCTYHIKVKVGDVVVIDQDFSYDSEKPVEIGKQFDSSLSGIVTIEFTNVSKALYIHSIGINTVDG